MSLFYGPEDDEELDYEGWLDKSGLEDSPENKGWYDCPEDERHTYIQENPDWWDKM